MQLLALSGLLALAQQASSETWRAWLVTPGGELPFWLELLPEENGWRAELVNEPERIPIVVERWDGRELALSIPPYESRISARLEGAELAGTWTKRRDATKVAEVPFHARRGTIDRFPRTATAGPPARVGGRWAVDFESDELPAVALFEQVERERELTGTFLTATGDHRYLAGAIDGDELALSCFDGSHAFLYRAKLQPDGALAGDFWSGNWYHERWTARRDENAALADPFAQTSAKERVALADLVFPDLTGKARCLAEPELAGKATLLVVFGSWCPNCNDEAKFLVELDAKYRARGLSILGLAFELTGDSAEDRAAVERFAERHGVKYPLFLAGTADKEAASLAIPLLDRVRAYPTTVFLASDGSVRVVHSGFAGPATGQEHLALRADFERRIEALLAEKPSGDEATWQELSREPWYCYEDEAFGHWFPGKFEFLREDSKVRITQRFSQHGEGGGQESTWEWPVRVRGDIVVIDRPDPETVMLLRLDAEVGVLTYPLSFGARFYREYRPTEELAARFLTAQGYDGKEADVRALSDPDARVRREALVSLAHRRRFDAGAPEVLTLLEDGDIGVRIAATWASGFCEERGARKALEAQLTHPNAALRRETVKALIDISYPEIPVAVESLAKDSHPLVRLETVSAIEEWARRSSEKLDVLVELAEDSDPLVRRRAASALENYQSR